MSESDENKAFNDAVEALPQPPKPPTWLRERMAQFYVDFEAFDERGLFALMEAMSKWIVVRAEYQWDRQAMHYVVAGEFLPQRLRGELVPWINLRFREEVVEGEKLPAYRRIFDGFDIP